MVERMRSADRYPQPPKSRQEIAIERRFDALDPLVQNYIYAVDGMAKVTSVSRMNDERKYLLGVFNDILKRGNHEELVVQLGGFFQYRNRIRNGTIKGNT